MEDSRQIENLIYRYAECIDNGDLAGVAELFRDGEIVSPEHDSRSTGYEQVLGLYRGSCRLHPPKETPLTKHLTSNVIVEIDEGSNTAGARSYYTVLQATPKLGLQPIICGRYVDRFAKSGGEWKFARREMYIDLLGDLSQHLLYDVGTL